MFSSYPSFMYNDGDIEWVPFPEPVVTAVDKIVEKAKQVGVQGGRIESVKHWEIVADLFRLWARFYPHEYKAFYDQQVELKRNQANEHGSRREKGGAEVQHVVEIPRRFYTLVKGIFPEVDRQLVGSKKFAMKWAQQMPILKIADKI